MEHKKCCWLHNDAIHFWMRRLIGIARIRDGGLMPWLFGVFECIMKGSKLVIACSTGKGIGCDGWIDPEAIWHFGHFHFGEKLRQAPRSEVGSSRRREAEAKR